MEKGKDCAVEDLINWDSLVDVVSNTLGIIVIMALITILLPKDLNSIREKTKNLGHSASTIEFDYQEGIQKHLLQVPWQHRTSEDKNWIYFILYKNSLIFVDFDEVARKKSKQSGYGTGDFTVECDRFQMEFQSIRKGDSKNQWFVMEPYWEMDLPEEEDTRDLQKYGIFEDCSPQNTVVVFMVYPTGHDLFTRVYHEFQKRGYELTWYPREKDYTLSIGWSYCGTPIEAE